MVDGAHALVHRHGAVADRRSEIGAARAVVVAGVALVEAHLAHPAGGDAYAPDDLCANLAAGRAHALCWRVLRRADLPARKAWTAVALPREDSCR